MQVSMKHKTTIAYRQSACSQLIRLAYAVQGIQLEQGTHTSMYISCKHWCRLSSYHCDAVAGSQATEGSCAFPAAASQKVAEAAVACAASVLQTCGPLDAESAADLLPRFVRVAEMDRQQASEEVCMSAHTCECWAQTCA